MPRVLNIKDYGYKVPDSAVYVGRAMPRYNLPASKWGNPFKIGRDGNRQETIEKYRDWLAHVSFLEDISELTGKDLVCWCSPLLCHADILLKLANKEGG